MFYICLLLLITSQRSASVSDCSHQHSTNEPSKWSQDLQGSQIQTSDMISFVEKGASLFSDLQLKISELSSLINSKKDIFTWDELRRNYEYYNLALQTVRYDFLVPRSLQSHADNVNDAYDVFQRLALAVEVVRLDLMQHGDMTVRTSHL